MPGRNELSGLIYVALVSKGILGWVGCSHDEFGMSLVCRWSLIWFLVGGTAPTGASL
jgi:hypothetical protein